MLIVPSEQALPRIRLKISGCGGGYGPGMTHVVGVVVNIRFPMAHGAPLTPGLPPELTMPAQALSAGRVIVMASSP